MASDSDKAALQREIYGEPIRDLVGGIVRGLGINQSAVATVLGLSPAMLSQLVTAQRVKIGNPLAVARLQALLVLADQGPQLTQQRIAQHLEEIRESRVTLAGGAGAVPARAPAEVVSRLLRAVASGQELHQAAAALDTIAPGLAALIRAYGTGSDADAARHLASVSHLLVE